MRRGWIPALAVGVALAAILMVRLRDSGTPRSSARQVEPGPTQTRPALRGPVPEGIDRRRLVQPDGPGAMPERIEYPLAAKYADEELSRVPHHVIGAWDAHPEEQAPADLRVFVLVVEPATSDAELEGLLRDAAARHRDCRYLRVQVFDSEAAARRPSWIDAGAGRAEHLVAELIRHPDPVIAALRVRGRSLDP